MREKIRRHDWHTFGLTNLRVCKDEDVDALEKENEKLRKQLDNTIKNWDEEDLKQTDYGIKLETELEDIKKENEELKNEVKILKRVLGLAETKRKSEYEYKV